MSEADSYLTQKIRMLVSISRDVTEDNQTQNKMKCFISFRVFSVRISSSG